MKHTKHAFVWVAVTMVGLLALDTAEARGRRARDEARAYCSQQQGEGIDCTVVQSGNGCGTDWRRARVFTDGETAYFACTRR